MLRDPRYTPFTAVYVSTNAVTGTMVKAGIMSCPGFRPL